MRGFDVILIPLPEILAPPPARDNHINVNLKYILTHFKVCKVFKGQTHKSHRINLFLSLRYVIKIVTNARNAGKGVSKMWKKKITLSNTNIVIPFIWDI